MSHQGGTRSGGHRRTVTTIVAIMAAAAIAAGVVLYNRASDHPDGPLPVNLPQATASYLGVFTEGLPASYAGVRAFTNATGAKPDVVMYYNGWYVPFPVSFATTAANEGAAPLIQTGPRPVSVSPRSLQASTTAT